LLLYDSNGLKEEILLLTPSTGHWNTKKLVPVTFWLNLTINQVTNLQHVTEGLK
jgi:hypothetical protein